MRTDTLRPRFDRLGRAYLQALTEGDTSRVAAIRRAAYRLTDFAYRK